MSVTITLTPEIEAQAAAQANAEGYALEDYLPRLIQNALPRTRPLVPLQQGSPEWLNLLFQAPSSTENGPPAIKREDLRRENLYEDRA